MPRKNSTSWSVGNPVTAARQNAINSDLDDLYALGSDRLKVYRISTDPALQVTIGAGNYRVWSTEWVYAGGTLTVANNVTTYIMLDGSGTIVSNTSWYLWANIRLATVVSSGGVITSITLFKNDAFGGDSGGNPTGAVLMWSTNTAPAGYLLCDGTAVSRTTYAALFALVSTTYGVGDGSTTFNLPNLKWSVPVGLDTGQAEFDVMGETGGAKTHTLGTTEIAWHTHTIGTTTRITGTVASPYWVKSDQLLSGAAESTWSAGGGQSHNNLQPYLVLTFIIKT